MKSILIIEDDIIFSRTIGNWLVKQGMRVESVTKLSDAKKSVREKEYDLILADLRLPDGNSTLFLEWLNDENYTIPFLIMTNYGQVENAVQAMQLGAVNYLCKPIRPDKLSEAIFNVLSKSHEENEFYRGESPQALELYKKLKLVALSDYSILIRGASVWVKNMWQEKFMTRATAIVSRTLLLIAGQSPKSLPLPNSSVIVREPIPEQKAIHQVCFVLPMAAPCFLMKSVICLIRHKLFF